MSHFDLNWSDTDNKKQPIYTVEWCINIEEANKYRAGEYTNVYRNRNCYLLNPTALNDRCSICFETYDRLLVLPYKQIVSIIPQVEDK